MTTLLHRALGAQVLVVVISDQVIHGPQIGSVRIHGGREAPGQRFQPRTCTMVYTFDPVHVVPELGQPLVITLSEEALDWAAAGWDNTTRDRVRRRFTGDVTDVSVRLDPNTFDHVVTVTAVSRSARLNRIVPFPLPTEFVYPQADDATRAAALLDTITATGYGSAVAGGTHDPGVYEVAPQPVNPDLVGRTAAAIFDDLSTSTAGELVEDRFAAVSWHDADHRRRGTLPDVTLTAADLLVGTSTQLNLNGIVNELTVDYAGTGAPVTVKNDASITSHGRHAATVQAPLLLTDTAATRLGQALLDRHAVPTWQYDALQVDVVRTLGRTPVASGTWEQQTGTWEQQTASWAGQRAAGLLALDLDQPLAVKDLPSNTLGTADLWLEGVTESITPNAWRLSLRVTPAT